MKAFGWSQAPAWFISSFTSPPEKRPSQVVVGVVGENSDGWFKHGNFWHIFSISTGVEDMVYQQCRSRHLRQCSPFQWFDAGLTCLVLIRATFWSFLPWHSSSLHQHLGRFLLVQANLNVKSVANPTKMTLKKRLANHQRIPLLLKGFPQAPQSFRRRSCLPKAEAHDLHERNLKDYVNDHVGGTLQTHDKKRGLLLMNAVDMEGMTNSLPS